MKKIYLEKLQHWISSFWIGIFLLVMIVSYALSFYVSVRSSQSRAISYFYVWEEDLSRNLILEHSKSLLIKLSSQLRELDSSIEYIGSDINDSEIAPVIDNAKILTKNCSFRSEIPISFSNLPVGNIYACFSQKNIAIHTLSSPIFIFSLLVCITLVFFSMSREIKVISEIKAAKQIRQMSRQVAHDIRGPLMALKTLAKISTAMPQDHQQLLLQATQRVNDIAEDLLKKSKSTNLPTQNNLSPIQFIVLNHAIEKILPEIKLRFENTDIVFKNYEKSPLLCGLSESEFQRIISNLLQNSFEAKSADQPLQIFISLRLKDEAAILEIIDTGRGIEHQDIESILSGLSLGKKNGNGLGLSQSKKAIENIGGQFILNSKIGVGTNITLQLPIQRAHNHSSITNPSSSSIVL